MKEMIARVEDEVKDSGVGTIYLTGEEIVRCKECKHGRIYNGTNQKLVACEFEEFSKNLDWFCADGEK